MTPAPTKSRRKFQKPKPIYDTPTGPTTQFQQHHDVQPPCIDRKLRREAWQIGTRLLALHDEGKIDRHAIEAARRYHDDHDIGIAGVSGRDPTGSKVDGGANHDRMTTLRMSALTRYREANEFVARRLGIRLGYQAETILVCCIVLDKKWADLARVLPRGSTYAGSSAGLSPLTAKTRTIDALRHLLAFYDELDGTERQGSDRIRAAYGKEEKILQNQ